MKRFVLIAAMILVVLGLAIPLANLAADPPQVTFATEKAHPSVAEVADVFAANCGDCHTNEGREPFYMSLPVAGSMMRADVEQGLAFLDMDRAFVTDAPAVNEAVLAKIERTVRQDTMPPGRYVALHWDASLDAQEREKILGWVRAQREAHYAPAGLPDEVAARTVRPILPPEGLDAAKVELGRKLFHDTRLSGDDTLSCASCHDLAKGGTDRAVSSTGIDGQVGPINSPTVFNAVYARRQFWDGRAADLKEQASGPVHNPIEMGSSWAQVIGKLEQDEAFVAEYRAVYGDELEGENLADAIAVFEASLVTPNAPFDRFLMGDEEAIDAQARRGWAVFQEAGCDTCHVGEALGGQSFERMGRERDYFADRGELTEVDAGRFNFTKDERDRFHFKVPTLRNVALTAPYFHDGSAEDLEAAVRDMARYQTERGLTDAEVQSVVAFLETLTGEYQGERLE